MLSKGMPNKFRLDGKTAFVFGGLGLIGKKVSSAFAAVGAVTIALDLEGETAKGLEREQSRKEDEVHLKYFDCADLNHLEEHFSEVVDEFGTPDVFINCAYPRTQEWGKSSFKEIGFASFRENVDIHMNSSAWLARLAAESMVLRERGGSIIQMGSIYGVLGQDLSVYRGTEMHENMAYATIKGGLTNLTRQMASYYGQFNVRVNTLCPGGLEGHVAGKSASQNPRFVTQYEEKTPLKRLGQPDEVACSALFLASDASSYVTGTTLMVDGGWSIV